MSADKKIHVFKPEFKNWNFIDDGCLKHQDYDTNHAYVSQYGPDAGCAGQWFWKVKRGNAELHGILPTVEEAVGRINSLLDIPIEAFVDEAAAEIVKEIEVRMRKLADIGAQDRIDGYMVGFEDGASKAQIDIREAVLKLFKTDSEKEAA
jgi:hypothetical protein